MQDNTSQKLFNYYPTARRGIHDQNSKGVPVMKYKVDDEENDNNTEQNSRNSQGQDVPDCVVRDAGKYKTIPGRKTTNRQARKGSWPNEQKDTCTTSMSMSLPDIYGSSPLRSSDDDSNGDMNSTPQRNSPLSEKGVRNTYYHEQSFSSNSTLNCSTSTPNTNNYYNESARFQNSNEGSSKSLVYILFTIIAVVVAFAVWYWYGEPLKDTKDKYDAEKYYKDLNHIAESFSISDDSMLQVQTAISTIFRRQDAGSVIFVYNSKENNFDKNVFNHFMDSISAASAKFLRNESHSFQDTRHTVVEVSELNLRTHGDLIKEYRKSVTQTGVMLVKELHHLPPTLAMAFHYYCDEYDPLVKNSAIFFTLDIALCSVAGRTRPTHTVIEKCLAKKWDSIPEDNIGPLLTRVVGTIIDVSNFI